MRKRLFSMLLIGAMIASVFSAVPAGAQVVPQVPATVNIEDPDGDAHGGSGAPGSLARADILKVWFTETTDWFMVHIQTTAAGNDPNSILYRVWLDAGAGECLQVRGFTAGVTSSNPGASTGSLRQTCSGDTVVPGEFFQVKGPDDTGIRTIALPRDAHEAFAAGTTLTPRAEVTAYMFAVTAPQIDGTDVGTPHEVTGGDPNSEPPPVDPGVDPDDPPTPDEPQKKDCSKKKGKAKKRCKKYNKGLEGETPGTTPPAGPGCAAYVPGEQGAEAETVVVKDEHTAEAPLELAIEQAPGAVRAEVRGHVFANIQVDSEAAEAGLFVRYSFPAYEDHDLYVRYADGALAAQAAGFNPIVEAPLVNDDTTVAGHSERGAEQVDGVRTADCAGYTVDFVNFLGRGGEYTVTMWLGEIENDPQAPAA